MAQTNTTTDVNCPNCSTAMQLHQGDSTDTPMGDCPNCKASVFMAGYLRLDTTLSFAMPEQIFKLKGYDPNPYPPIEYKK